jgi:adenylosuccinate lyase
MIFSEGLMLALMDKGLRRDHAYAIAQRNAMKVWEGKAEDFKAALLEDHEVGRLLSREEVKECFDVKKALRHVDFIFKRVFQPGKK